MKSNQILLPRTSF